MPFVKSRSLKEFFGRGSELAFKFSEKIVHKLEDQLFKGGLNESSALQLLRIYQRGGRHERTQKALDIIMSSNLRSRELSEFAVQHYLRIRDYYKAYRYSKDLCYHYDRYGDALLQLSRIAILISHYNLAAMWLHEYLRHNTMNRDIAYYWLGHCFLRQRSLSHALSCLNKGKGYLTDVQLFRWLTALDEGKQKQTRQNWFGHKARPMRRLQTLNWKNNVLNSHLVFEANSIAQIDEWINSGSYVSDERLFGQADRWQLPSEIEKYRCGDCEDFSLWAWVQLLRMNVNARFMLGGLFDNELNHAWVCIYNKDGVKVLECTPSQFNVPIAAKNAPEYLPLLSLDKSLQWYSHQ